MEKGIVFQNGKFSTEDSTLIKIIKSDSSFGTDALFEQKTESESTAKKKTK